MTRYIEDLNENTAPVSGDYLLCYDASAGSTDKDRKVNVSKFAVLATASTFTATQTVAPTNTAHHALVANMPTSTTGYGWLVQYNSATRQYAQSDAASNKIELSAVDLGATHGPHVAIGRNTNAGAVAAGFLRMSDYMGTYYNMWMDATGLFRLSSSVLPTNANDQSGSSTVVGTQSSSLDTKDVIAEFTDYDGALATIIAAPLYDFVYKSGAYHGERFTGIITDYSPAFGMDRDDAHPSGKSLNDITGFGYTVAAFKALTRRIEELEGKLT